jgi:hypothetical protein
MSLKSTRGAKNTAYQWSHELAKLPAPSVSWRWSDHVGGESWKCEYSAAYKMRRAGCIIKQDNGEFRVSEALERYLSGHGVELAAWRADIVDYECVFSGDERVAERREDGVRCVACSASFDTARGARVHYAAAHAPADDGDDSEERRGEQVELQEFERVSDELVVGADGQCRLTI